MDAFSFHHLKIFACVIKNGSLARAAEELLLSQSTVSIHLKNLENYFGVKLLERQGRTFKPTLAGAVLYRAAKESLENLDAVRNQIMDIARGSAGGLSVGIPSTLGTYILPEIIKNFRKRYPGVELSVQLGSISNVLESVCHERAELGITIGIKKTEGLQYIPYFTDRIVFVASSQYVSSFPGKEILGPADLRDLTLITRKSSSSTHKMILRELNERNVIFREVVCKSNLEQIKEDILNNTHIAAISLFIIHGEIESGLLKLLNIANLELTRPVCFIHRKEQELSPLAVNFINLCRVFLPIFLSLAPPRLQPSPGQACHSGNL